MGPKYSFLITEFRCTLKLKFHRMWPHPQRAKIKTQNRNRIVFNHFLWFIIFHLSIFLFKCTLWRLFLLYWSNCSIDSMILESDINTNSHNCIEMIIFEDFLGGFLFSLWHLFMLLYVVKCLKSNMIILNQSKELF